MSVPTLETTGTPLSQAQQARAIQAALAASLTRQVASAWPVLDPKRLDDTWPNWLQMMSALIVRFRGMSSLAASIHYQDVRQTVVGQRLSDGLLKLAGEPDPKALERALGFAGPKLLSDPASTPESALSVTQGTAQRFVADANRSTVLEATKADPRAIGWYRVTDGRPCAFCALLASRVVGARTDKRRGALYGEDTVNFKAHNACGCTAAPLFDRQQELPALATVADRIYNEIAHLPNSERLPAFRKAWAEHLAG